MAQQQSTKVACVSGANGFIGKHLASRLRECGYTVYPIPRDYLSNPALLWDFFIEKQPELIVHLAAYGNHSTQNEDMRIFDVNVVGTFNMLEASKDIPYKAFINVSTSAVQLPITSLYSASKHAGEDLAKAFAQKYKKNITNVRPFSVYGPGEADNRLIPTICRCLVSGEEMSLAPDPTHDWIYIDDFTRYTSLLAERAYYFKGQTINIGTEDSYSNFQIVLWLEEISKKQLKRDIKYPQREYDDRQWVSDSTKLFTAFGKPYFTLGEGLQRCYDYYKQRYQAQDTRN